MILHFADDALAALLASPADLEALLGRQAVDVMLCIGVLRAISHLAELRLFVFTPPNLSRSADGAWTIEMTSNGTGVRLRPVDEHRRPITTAPLIEAQVFEVELTSLISVSTPVHGGGDR